VWTARGAGVFSSVRALCASSDGLTLALAAVGAADGALHLFHSADAGTHFWENAALSGAVTNFGGLACSGNGSALLVAGSLAGQGLNVSSNGGAAWAAVPFDPAAQPAGFLCVGMSSDGAIMYAQPRLTARLWRSADGGATFAPLGVSFQGGDPAGGTFAGLAVSGDGSRVFAGGGAPGVVYRTGDGGASWAPVAAIASAYAAFPFGCLALSPDGARVVAASTAGGGPFLVSGDGGVNWAPASPASIAYAWQSGGGCAAVSSDGARLAAVNYDANAVYTSVDGGASLQRAGAGGAAADIAALALSADGGRLFIGHAALLTAGVSSSPTPSPSSTRTLTGSGTGTASGTGTGSASATGPPSAGGTATGSASATGTPSATVSADSATATGSASGSGSASATSSA
jgi:hypothetical protein